MELVSFVNQQESKFVSALSGDTVKWQKESQFAIQAFQGNDFLAQTAFSNQQSAVNAIVNVAAIGISLNPASKLAYLVPRDKKVCLDISYMGLLHIAMTSGVILWGQCKLVHQADTYEPQGLGLAPIHKYNAFATEDERGPVIGGYCTVKTPQGDFLTEEMSLKEIKKVEDSSKSKNGPWRQWWSEMARKTIVKRASKYWPRADRVDKAIDVLNEDEGIWQEPVLPHTSEKEILEGEVIRANEFIDKVSALCDEMAKADNEATLKALFKEAFTMTKGEPLQKNVQHVYNERKTALGIK